MPFTLSHAAAALPFRRAHLVPSALVIGTFAPDLEYFIRLMAGGGWGHTVPGAFGLDLPLGLGTLWVFHRLVKAPLLSLLPDSIRRRAATVERFRFGPLSRFALILVSLLIGIATHLLWDGFTHPQYWFVRHWALLEHVHHYPVLGWSANCMILQMVSSVAGLLVLALWAVAWFRRTKPRTDIEASPFTWGQRAWVVAIGCAAACAGALARAWLGVGIPSSKLEISDFVGQAIVTFGALCWWQLAMWGVLGKFREGSARAGSRVPEAARLKQRG